MNSEEIKALIEHLKKCNLTKSAEALEALLSEKKCIQLYYL